MTAPKHTPLYEAHIKAGARMIDFSGWLMPVQYDGIVAEHTRTRSDASMFDTCHMGRFDVAGVGADEALSRVLTADVMRMRNGQCRYGFLLDDDGGVLDDLIAYRFNADHWMLVVNAGTRAGDVSWFREQLPSTVTFADESDRTGKLDVQGPGSLEVASRVLSVDVSSLGYFKFLEFTRAGDRLIVSRTGYTGEKGIEVYGPVPAICALWEAFLAAGVRPAGLGARDTLRLEAGLPLYGHELNRSITPVEAGMERYAMKQAPFIGKEAMSRHLAAGPARRLCGFRTRSRQSARAGNVVRDGGAVVGEVTSGSFSPSLQYAIGFAYVETPSAIVGRPLLIDTGRNVLDAEVVGTPFYRPSEAKGCI